MKIAGITPYVRANSNTQVQNFGLIPNPETEKLLPANKEEIEHLRAHDAVTIKSDGQKAWGEINEGFQKLYDFLLSNAFSRPNYLVDLQKKEYFKDFFDRLLHCDLLRRNPNFHEQSAFTMDRREGSYHDENIFNISF